MPIRLGLPKEPEWLDLEHGVSVRVRPLTTAIFEAARASADMQVRELFDAKGNVEGHGGIIDGLPDLETEEGRAGYSNFIFAQALARQGILEWKGVCDDAGNEVKATPERINEMMTWHVIADTFVRRYSKPFRDRIIEKKDCSPSANGISAAVQSTAAAAN